MALPFIVAIKDFLDLYVLTPFERELFKWLSEALEPKDREVLAYQRRLNELKKVEDKYDKQCRKPPNCP